MEEIIFLQNYKKQFYMEPKKNVQNIWKTVLLNSTSGVTYKLTLGPENGTILITAGKENDKVEYYVRDARIVTQQTRNEVLEEDQKRKKQKRMKAMLGAGVAAVGQIGIGMITGHTNPIRAGHSVENTYNSLLSEHDIADGFVISEFLYKGRSVSYAHYDYRLLYLSSKYDNQVVQKGVPPQFYLPLEKNHCVTIERTDVFDFHIFEFWSEKDADAVLDKMMNLMK